MNEYFTVIDKDDTATIYYAKSDIRINSETVLVTHTILDENHARDITGDFAEHWFVNNQDWEYSGGEINTTNIPDVVKNLPGFDEEIAKIEREIHCDNLHARNG